MERGRSPVGNFKQQCKKQHYNHRNSQKNLQNQDQPLLLTPQENIPQMLLEDYSSSCDERNMKRASLKMQQHENDREGNNQGAIVDVRQGKINLISANQLLKQAQKCQDQLYKCQGISMESRQRIREKFKVLKKLVRQNVVEDQLIELTQKDNYYYEITQQYENKINQLRRKLDQFYKSERQARLKNKKMKERFGKARGKLSELVKVVIAKKQEDKQRAKEEVQKKCANQLSIIISALNENIDLIRCSASSSLSSVTSIISQAQSVRDTFLRKSEGGRVQKRQPKCLSYKNSAMNEQLMGRSQTVYESEKRQQVIEQRCDEQNQLIQSIYSLGYEDINDDPTQENDREQ